MQLHTSLYASCVAKLIKKKRFLDLILYRYKLLYKKVEKAVREVPPKDRKKLDYTWRGYFLSDVYDARIDRFIVIIMHTVSVGFLLFLFFFSFPPWRAQKMHQFIIIAQREVGKYERIKIVDTD